MIAELIKRIEDAASAESIHLRVEALEAVIKDLIHLFVPKDEAPPPPPAAP